MRRKSSSSARSAARDAASSQRARREETREGNITVVSRGDPKRGETDWAALDRLTDEDITAAMAKDPEWAGFEDADWTVLVMPAKKKAISIRVDEDVLDFFKKQGAGYQRRINAVLRSYMREKRKKKGA